MDLHRRRDRGFLGVAGVVLGGLFAMLSAGSARALTCPGATGCFVYKSGDLVTVFVNGGNEFIADLGPLASLSSTPIVLSTAATGNNVLGSTGGIGGTFLAYETNTPFSGTTRSITFTTDPSVNPPGFDNNLSTYVGKIPAAQSALDTGAVGGSPDWLQGLNTFTTGLIFTPSNLAIATNNPSSYTSVLNGNGLNQISGNLPFSTAPSLTGNGQVVDLWGATRTGLTTSKTTLLGMLTVDGNFATNEVRITFTAVPEPGTLALACAGLAGVAWMGRSRRTA